MNAYRDWKRLVALAFTSLAFSTSALAIPPPPPAQKGTRVSSYTCSSNVMTFQESWDYSASTERKFVVLINDKKLSDADAERITEEIATSGPFQSNSAICINSDFELILLRYTPSAAQLHLSFSGRALNRVGVSDASTGFKLMSRSPMN